MPAGSAHALVAACAAALALPVAPAGAQAARGPAREPDAVSVAGRTGAETWVLVSGTVGGVAGYRRLEARLLARGDRVLIVDPYRLSADSADLSFTALARNVDAVLARHDVAGAHVVAHAHGAGVALRLAANAPERVGTLTFLDAGALDVSRSRVLSASLRLVPLVARVPGGRGFLRERIVKGLRENSGHREWIDEPTRLAYAEPLLKDVDRVVALAFRVSRAREPEPIPGVVARVRAPLTIILGTVPRPTEPKPEEFALLAPLGARLRIERLAGVGHFVHEEAPDDVARLLVAPRPAALPAAVVAAPLHPGAR